nr:pro-neuregulin-4, membrane-bound isoform isoform X1 [Vicugna pacos]XP_031547583.1 pro-neuregulin-4, membrane-bound isoform isoform X1 [Vicugna pacos]XP_031547584.1 pro-neuregulin-4, membrane-bound isoform isoform X1 [Vicugna pacos]XP_031547586.1 pro-neuregulin-4, membrane-bound isoform isoform X1 [Vicugna pacos]XP_031547587.1 pro-neuregulin-4, membrane-bound isoform isoform X1 [Vicugna pacos]XP_031547588.1 pro-neuregulin-4, membrane-bound isoform isoform X1 [Vicugna pacos]XP_031547589.1 pr
MPTDHEEPCGASHRSFCLNGGICYVIPTIPSPFCRCIENYTGARCEEVFLPSSSIQTRSDLFAAFVALAVLGTLIIGALYFLCRISHHVVRSLNSTKNPLQLISQTTAVPTTSHLNKPSQTSSSVESLVDARFSYQLTTNTETPSRNCPAVIPQNRRATFRGPAPPSVTSAWWRPAAPAPTTVKVNFLLAVSHKPFFSPRKAMLSQCVKLHCWPCCVTQIPVMENTEEISQ